MNLEATLRQELPKALAAEAAALCAQAIAEQADARHIARTLPACRELEVVMHGAIRDLAAAVAGDLNGWPRFVARVRASTWLRARCYAAQQVAAAGRARRKSAASARRAHGARFRPPASFPETDKRYDARYRWLVGRCGARQERG